MDEDLVVRALWLAYIGKYTQEQIASYLNVSRQKVQRLIAEGITKGYISVEICHDIAELVGIEERIKSLYGLQRVQVVPSLPGNQSSEKYMESLGLAGSLQLIELLADNKCKTIGMGWGRTISHMARHFHKQSHVISGHHKYVSLMGSLNSNSANNPMNLIYLFGENTNAETYFLPAPFLADSIGHRKILEQQKSVQQVMNIANNANHCFVSIGEVALTSSVLKYDLISKQQLNELIALGAAADVLGTFIDDEGVIIDHPINQLSISADIKSLNKKNTIAICGGVEKVKAIKAVLRAKLINGLITDEFTAHSLLEKPNI